jgi:uncharacterized protein
MNRSDTALAVFVKTPGFSAVKTRLAAGIGRDQAETFYQLSIAALKETLQQPIAGLAPYWAVAEQEALTASRWSDFPRISQGEGELGERLNLVFEELLATYRSVIAIGGDSPQLTSDLLAQAAALLNRPSERPTHVIGRCHDGGFYLFGANYRIPLEVWNRVAWGTPKAADSLLTALGPHALLLELPARTDTDVAADLRRLRDELGELPELSPTQLALLSWLRHVSPRDLDAR